MKHYDSEAQIAFRNQTITELRDALAARDKRIAELEKQAAIDKALLALADARINRELRDDFAGRALQSIPGDPSGADGFTLKERATWSFQQADEMLKAKGGA